MLKGTKSYKGSAKPDDPIYTAGYVIGKPQPMVSHGNTPQNEAIHASQDDPNKTPGTTAVKTIDNRLKRQDEAAASSQSQPETEADGIRAEAQRRLQVRHRFAVPPGRTKP